MDLEQLLPMFMVTETEFLSEGCSQCLESLWVEQTPMFVAETIGGLDFPSSCKHCVNVLHINARLLATFLSDICRSKMSQGPRLSKDLSDRVK